MRVFVLATAFCLLLGLPLAIIDRRGLALPLSLFGLYLVFLLVDCGHVGHWRGRLLRAWHSGNVNLAVYAGAMAGLPALPRATLATMMRTLPGLTPAQDRDLSAAQRAALAAFSTWRWREETAATLLPGAILALLSGAAAALLLAGAAPDARSGMVLLGLLASLWLIRLAIPGWQRARLTRAVADLAPAEAGGLPGLAASLDWSSTSTARRRKMIQRLGQLTAR